MPILAAVIGEAQTTDILCEHGCTKPQKELLHQVLPMIKRHDTKSAMEYTPAQLKINYIVENKLLYLALTDNKEGMRIPFTYLEDIKDKFKAQYGKGGYPNIGDLSPAACKPFSAVMKDRMSFCNDKDKIKTLQRDIEEVKGVMMENIDAVIERGGKIDDLVAQSEELAEQGGEFRRGAKTLKRNMCLRNWKLAVGAVLLLAILITVIVLIACKGACD
eukprot:TRINITY_DN4607_c0_g1_i1.p1 TRINITY_DN4607_c0_g1~~TRINITY_DN4607_c0_g1_i1.p1  ORF type:complete len:249 (+),score=120.24 TRINITY_DN4607_c0_g1_i1:95-748(+)